ncbi:MAG: 50S ribosomal protein L23 [Myxococcota bacterium]
MKNPYDIIIRPVMTEKSNDLLELENKVTFRVKFDANKIEIKEAVKILFDVDVDGVNTLIMPGKPKRVGRFLGRRRAWKKAIVQLAEGEYIDFYALEGAGEDAGVV